jgi:hypothetical protein
LWFSIGIGLAILAIFPGLLSWVSDRFGIAYPPATFMLLALSFLLVLVLHFSWELSRLEDRTRALAEEYALLRLELDERISRHESAQGPGSSDRGEDGGVAGGAGGSPAA